MINIFSTFLVLLALCAFINAQCPSNCAQRNVPDIASCCKGKIFKNLGKTCKCMSNSCIAEYYSKKDGEKTKRPKFNCVTDASDCTTVDCNQFFDDPNAGPSPGPAPSQNPGEGPAPPPAPGATCPGTSGTGLTLENGQRCSKSVDCSNYEDCLEGYCFCKRGEECEKFNVNSVVDKLFCLEENIKCGDSQECVKLGLGAASKLRCVKGNTKVMGRCQPEKDVCENKRNKDVGKCINNKCYCTTISCFDFNDRHQAMEYCNINNLFCGTNSECITERVNQKPVQKCICKDGYEGDGKNCKEMAVDYKCQGIDNGKCLKGEKCYHGLCYCETIGDPNCVGNANIVLKHNELCKADIGQECNAPESYCVFNRRTREVKCLCSKENMVYRNSEGKCVESFGRGIGVNGK